MMRTIEQFLERINGAFDGEAWFGTPLRRGLDGIGEELARGRPMADGHSIFEIVVHAGAWMDVVAGRLRGEVIESASVEDWSDVTLRSWPAAIEELEAAQSRLADAVARLTPAALEETVIGQPLTARQLLDGAISHNVYHAGQIALLKKLGAPAKLDER